MTVGVPVVGVLPGDQGALAAELDPELPGLAAALDRSTVARRFQHQWPAAGPVPAITSAVAEHVRWTPGIECVVTYRLSLAPLPGNANSTMGSVVVTAAGDQFMLFDADPDLPGLAAATDPGIMAGWLTRHLGRSVDSCSITPVTYRLSSRCVLRYDLICGGDTVVLYGKVRSGTGGQDLASTLAALGEPLVPRLVAVAPDWQLVVQADGGRRNRAAAGSTIAPPDAVLAEFAEVGDLLGRLHSRSAPAGELRGLADDLDLLEGYLPAAHRADTAVAARMGELIEQLRGEDGEPSPAVPSHGAFRSDQVRFGPGGPTLIDLDSYCWAEPARDVANFLAYLRWQVIRARVVAGTGADLRAAFVHAYGRQTGAQPDPDRLRRYVAASLLKIAGRRYRRVAVDEWSKVPRLVDAAQRLAQGEQTP